MTTNNTFVSIKELNRLRENTAKMLAEKFKKSDALAFEKIIFETIKVITTDLNNFMLLYSIVAYEKIYQLLTGSEEDLKTFINNLRFILFNDPIFLDIRNKEEEVKNLTIRYSSTVDDGEFTCINKLCKSKKCTVEFKQTRSADEGTTTFITCSECGKVYTVS
jgi:DNA-directed RNA polymerase subunit M/transcription elongation factor TFIIS